MPVDNVEWRTAMLSCKAEAASTTLAKNNDADAHSKSNQTVT